MSNSSFNDPKLCQNRDTVADRHQRICNQTANCQNVVYFHPNMSNTVNRQPRNQLIEFPPLLQLPWSLHYYKSVLFYTMINTFHNPWRSQKLFIHNCLLNDIASSFPGRIIPGRRCRIISTESRPASFETEQYNFTQAVRADCIKSHEVSVIVSCCGGQRKCAQNSERQRFY